MKYEVIITAAGSGSRMQLEKNKIFVEIAGKPCIVYSLETFLQDADVEHIYVTLSYEDMDTMHELIRQYLLDTRRITLVIGGMTRQASVYEALKKIKSYEVLIHDGARPFVTLADINKVKQALKFDKGAILALQATDTVKEANAALEINRTLDRSKIFLAQTPQGFDTQALLKANELAIEDAYEGTDDASLIEYANSFYVKIVEGNRLNIKITYPEDLLIAEQIIKIQNSEVLMDV